MSTYTKEIALFDYVEVDDEDLSVACRSVAYDFTDSEEDVSGFNPDGVDETLPGTRSQSVTCEFFDTPEVHDILYPIWKNRESVPFKHRRNQNAPVSATNKQLEGMAKMFGYSPQRSRGTAATFSVTFRAADADGFDFVETS